MRPSRRRTPSGSLAATVSIDGDFAGERLQLLGFVRRPAAGAGDDDRLAGIERAIAGGAMGEAAAFIVVFVGQAEPALGEAGGDDDGAAGVALAFGGLDRPGAVAGEVCDFAEADLDARAASASSVSRRGDQRSRPTPPRSRAAPVRLISAPPGASLSRQRLSARRGRLRWRRQRPGGPAPTTMTSKGGGIRRGVVLIDFAAGGRPEEAGTPFYTPAACRRRCGP